MSSSSSPPPSGPPLSVLAVFRNILNQELIRSVHAYRDDEEGDEGRRWIEREFVFSPTSCIEIRESPLILLDRWRAKFAEGEKVGLWLCVLAFDSASLSSAPFSAPPFLCFSRNPQLKSIPTLANDLQKVYLLMSRANKTEPINFSLKETCSEKADESSLSRGHESTSSEDQSSASSPPTKLQIGQNHSSNQVVPEAGLSLLKKRRAATDRVASISLSELTKYFNLPITEASRNLKVGLTVLKRKCREFGIPRWPHRKIKSLDMLIHNLQEEVSRQQKDNGAAAAVKAAVKAVTKRQQMLESEKEGIEQSPFMELQRETKKFRQDVFKRRHKAKALSKIDASTTSSSRS